MNAFVGGGALPSSADVNQAEAFRGLLLRHRGRAGVTQGELATRVGVGRRTIQDWEAGTNSPRAERLQALISALLEAGGLPAGEEAEETEALWDAVERASSRQHPTLDRAWLARLLAERAMPAAAVEPARASSFTDTERRQDWGEAPDVLGFVNRTQDLARLRGWVLEERCRVVAVLGMGGIGKTMLTAKLAQLVAPSFERVYWRSLRHEMPASEWLAGAIGFLSDNQLELPAGEADRLLLLLQLLRERRCLLVLDNFETLFEPGECDGRYRQGLAGYGRLLQALGGAAHQSCVVLTSRETPAELSSLVGSAVRTLRLGGLGADAVQLMLAPKQLVGTSQHWTQLTSRLGGNPLALKMVGDSIRDLFAGDIGAFLQEAGAFSVFGGVRRLVAEQVERSSAPEQQVLRVVAAAREPVTLGGLLAALGPCLGRSAVLEVIEVLGRRSLVERAATPGAAAFMLPSLVLAYVTDRLVEDASGEIERSQSVPLIHEPLVQAPAKDDVRQTPEPLIGEPIVYQHGWTRPAVERAPWHLVTQAAA